MREEKGKIGFVRTLIVFFSLLLIAMILFNYFFIEPKGDISPGIITLLLILIIVVLSESFDSFSIGKLITVSREKKEKEKAVEKLEREKADLFNQIIKITSSQSQSQIHTNVYGDYHAEKDARVEKATVEDLEKNKEQEQSDIPSKDYRIDLRGVEKIALDKFLNGRKINLPNVITDAKLVTEFHGIDPISNIQPIFDGYYKNSNNEMFMEFIINRWMGMMVRERIYMMLSKLNFYKTVKNIDAHLELIWVNIPEEESRRMNYNNIERFAQDFAPAIASGLLKINEVEISSEEIEGCKQKK